MDIIQTLAQKASSLSENDLSWILPKIHDKYHPIIINFATAAKQSDALAKAAFEITAKKYLNQAVNTFFFKKKHWQNNVNLHSYLIKTLSNLKSEKLIENSVSELVNSPVCPLCKIEKHKEFLNYQDKFYHCKRCQEIVHNYEKLNDKNQYKIDLRKIFIKHSKKGVRCPDCKSWVPDSAFDFGVLPCPYDCGFIGNHSEYIISSHPVSLTSREHKSLNKEIFSQDGSNKKTSLEDRLTSSLTEQEEFILSEDLEYQSSVIKEVIIQQQKLLHNTTTSATIIQKKLMYQAFINLLEKLPYEMTMYLGYQKNVSKIPLQSQIFQEYANLILDYMPFEIVKGKNKYNIIDPCNPELSLFLGISTYTTVVEKNGTIPNKTIENYIGGKQIKDYGSCFIGKLISVSSEGEDITDKVVYYTFNEIKIDAPLGTNVEVKHFRIASHYEMHSLVFLQRIRRAIVDKVYFILNKEKRKVK